MHITKMPACVLTILCRCDKLSSQDEQSITHLGFDRFRNRVAFCSRNTILVIRGLFSLGCDNDYSLTVVVLLIMLTMFVCVFVDF